MTIVNKYKYNILAITSCLLSVLIIYAMFDIFFDDHENINSEVIIKGILDLRHSEITNDFMLPLSGEWEYFEGAMINSNEQSISRTKLFVHVPDQWNNYPITRTDPKSFGYGTYHLQIMLPENDRIYSLNIQNIGMAHRLFVNSKLIKSSGTPSSEIDEYTILNVPYSVNLIPRNNSLDIYIQVANFDYYPYSGIVSNILFGTDESIRKYQQKNQSLDWTIISSLCIIGIIFFIVYLYRRNSYFLLYFSLYTFFGMIYFMSHGEKLWYQLFPEFDYRFFTRIQYFSAGSYITMFLLYLYTGFEDLFKNKVTKILIIISIGMLIPCVGFPLMIQSQFSSYQMLFVEGAIIYSVYGFSLGIIKREENSFIVSVGSFMALISTIISVQIVQGVSGLNIPLVISQLAWILMHALLIAIRLSKAYDEIDQLSKELILLDKQKDAFLAKTAHEFKSPLNGVTNIVQSILERNKNMSFEQQEGLHTVIDISNRLSRLVNDIIDINKIQEGKLTVILKSVEVGDLLGRIVELFRFIYGKEEFEIYYEVSDSFLNSKKFILADEDRFKQIMINLIETGLKYSSQKKIHIYLSGFEEKVIIKIKLISEALDLNRSIKVFESVSDLNKGGTPKEEIDLGLSIATELIEASGGSIEIIHEANAWLNIVLAFVESEADHETNTAASCISKYEEYNESTESIQSPKFTLKQHDKKNRDIDSNEKGSIMIVGDLLDNIKVLTDVLMKEGYYVDLIESGQSTFEQIDHLRKYDLLIMDIMLSDMSGYQVSKAIRERYTLSELPILFLTSSVQAIDGEKILLYGGNDFLYMPFQLSEIRTKIMTLLAMKRSVNQIAEYEIAFLHAQIKPHFLYNALNTIVSVCENSSPEGAELIMSLAKYLRGTLDFSNFDRRVTYEKELSLIKAYLKIEKARFSNLSIAYDIDQVINVMIPPISLQVLVENAVKHGRKEEKAMMEIVVSIKKNSDGYCFIVQDNGIGLKRSVFESIISGDRVNQSIGLFNLNKRLNRLVDSSLVLYDSVNGTKIGFCVKG